MLCKKNLATVWAALVTLAVGTSCGRQGGGEKIDLRFRLQEGRSYKLQMVADQRIAQTIQGQKQQMTQTLGVAFTSDEGELSFPTVSEAVMTK